MSARVLIVDDDPNICELLRLYTEKEGYRVETAEDGNVALEKAAVFRPDLVLLDLMLPGKSGWQVCRELQKDADTAVIMVTAKGETPDKIHGLELGADDYITKPFEAKEVMARIKAVLRRKPAASHNDSGRLSYDGLQMDRDTRSFTLKGKLTELPPKEFDLLFLLASNPNRVFSRDELLDDLWGFDFYGDSRTVDVHIKRLREKLENVSPHWQLETVWRVGYKFAVDSL